MLGEGEPPRTDEAPSTADGVLDAARDALKGALQVAEASLALLRAELRLAKQSALNLVWLGFALIFLGVGAWVATNAAIAAGLYQWTGNAFIGIGVIALANVIGVLWVLRAMQKSWADLSLPKTREMFAASRQPPVDASSPDAIKKPLP